MRHALVLIPFALASTLAAQPPAPAATPQAPVPPPQTQKPVFRAGVDLLTVDATVVDRDGRQITTLTPADFIVEVDGDARPVVSAEYVQLVDATPAPIGTPRPAPPKPSPDEAFFSTNTRALTPGRLILLLVDEGNIRIGQGRQMMRSAVKFVDGLSPLDRLAMVAVPRGRLVDFTTNHEPVREALLATVGQAQAFKGRFNISLTEAIATAEHSDANLRAQLILRECGAALLSPVEAARCEIEVEQEASEIVNHQRQQTLNSIRGIREVLRSLAALEGPKSVILISEGLVLDGLTSDVDELAAIAADVRASLDVMLLDVPAVDVSESQRPTTPREDRDRQTEGLESLAGLARGALHRVITSGDSAFVRVMRSIAGHYLLAVEARPRDRDGRRHRIQVKLNNRRGATIYSRRGFLATTAPSATTPADAVGRALRAPLTMNDVPMRLGTWTYKEPGTDRVRVLFAVEVERTTTHSLDYTVGLMIIDRNNKVIANNVEPRALPASPADPGLAVYSGSAVLEAGTYMVRFAIADSEGRMGSVERKFDAWQMSAAGVTVGDLLVAEQPTDGKSQVVASLEPQVGSGRLAAMMEIYAPNLQSMSSLKASLDVIPEENGKPLASVPMQIGAGPSPEIGVLQASLNTTALPPGRYLARAAVTEGGKARGHISRPFRVVAGAATTDNGDLTISRAPSLPADLLTSMLANLPAFDRKDLLQPDVLAAVFTAAERSRPSAKAAIATARAGKMGPAALEALEAGDQPIAAFIRGLDFFAQGLTDRALQQFQLAMQQVPSFAPARLYLGASLAQGNRHREAAGLLQSVSADVAGPVSVARLAGLSWLRAGDASLAIAAMKPALGAQTDAATTRTLALAYVAANRPPEALPLLTTYLQDNPTDQEALLAGVYATYATHSPATRADTITADRMKAQTWAKAYAAQKGVHQALVDAWIRYLASAK